MPESMGVQSGSASTPMPVLLTLPPGTDTVAYPAVTLSSWGGIGPHTFESAGPSLPTGMVLSSAGVLSGTPEGAATYSVIVRVTDSFGAVGHQTFTLVIAA